MSVCSTRLEDKSQEERSPVPFRLEVGPAPAPAPPNSSLSKTALNLSSSCTLSCFCLGRLNLGSVVRREKRGSDMVDEDGQDNEGDGIYDQGSW